MTDLARAIESHRDAILDLSCRLISIPSENPPGNHYRAAADLIRAHLESLGFETQTCRDCILTSIGDGPRTLDRKSTRLNSSHVRISYAVFCLKKKKHTRHQQTLHKTKKKTTKQ